LFSVQSAPARHMTTEVQPERPAALPVSPRVQPRSPATRPARPRVQTVWQLPTVLQEPVEPESAMPTTRPKHKLEVEQPRCVKATELRALPKTEPGTLTRLEPELKEQQPRRVKQTRPPEPAESAALMPAKQGKFEESCIFSPTSEPPEPTPTGTLSGLEHKLNGNRFVDADVDVDVSDADSKFEEMVGEVKPEPPVHAALEQLWPSVAPLLSPQLVPSLECEYVEVVALAQQEALSSWLPSTLKPPMPATPARLEHDRSVKTPGRPLPSKLHSPSLTQPAAPTKHEGEHVEVVARTQPWQSPPP